ncbi:MAG: nucleoside hydrolase [Oscillospiraceae bacterium]|nr:nucleoside hydrolase [Oscillospiraceae bacterium]
MERLKNVILDTDIGPDCDDAGAIAVLNKFSDFGEAKPLAMGNCTVHAEGACCIDAINWYYGRHAIPVGTLKSEDGPGKGDERYLKYNKFIADNFDHTFKHTLIPDVLSVYREALEKVEDNSVIFITIGMLTNIKNLMQSGLDGYSSFSGAELMEKKVKKLVCMAGNFRAGHDDFFPEFNINTDIEAARYVVGNFKGEIVFCPYEMGYPIVTGTRLISMGDMKKNPVAKAYQIYCGEAGGRNSWDLVTVYYAVRGTHGMFKESRKGILTIDENGYTYFKEDPNGNHMITANKMPPAEIAQVLEDIINLSPELVR